MSEYQYYEFLAIDHPLGTDEQAEVRTFSTRATITPTSFVNEYEWGDFKGDPDHLVEHYYDAHLHLTNWGTHRVMLRLPLDLLSLAITEDFHVGDQVTAWTTTDHIVLDFTIDDQPGEFEDDHSPDELLPAIVDVRTDLAAGDLRPLYLAWLAAYALWERDEDAFTRDADNNPEPPVPPGLNSLTTAQRALADFLRLDDALITVAARTSPPLENATDDLTAWIAALPTTKKNSLLTRVAQGEAAKVRTELLHRFHTHNTPTRRTVGSLLDDAARLRTERHQTT